jgi:predicted nucleic acid-binding protein
MHYVIDTNAILRFLLSDNLDQQEKTAKLFHDAHAGKCFVTVLPIVCAEVAYILESHYKQTRKVIAEHLRVLISQTWISVPERRILLHTIQHFTNGTHFVDAFLLSYAKEHQHTLFTFDKKLQKQIAKN